MDGRTDFFHFAYIEPVCIAEKISANDPRNRQENLQKHARHQPATGRAPQAVRACSTYIRMSEHRIKLLELAVQAGATIENATKVASDWEQWANSVIPGRSSIGDALVSVANGCVAYRPSGVKFHYDKATDKLLMNKTMLPFFSKDDILADDWVAVRIIKLFVVHERSEDLGPSSSQESKLHVFSSESERAGFMEKWANRYSKLESSPSASFKFYGSGGRVYWLDTEEVDVDVPAVTCETCKYIDDPLRLDVPSPKNPGNQEKEIDWSCPQLVEWPEAGLILQTNGVHGSNSPKYPNGWFEGAVFNEEWGAWEKGENG